jgi:hypothetical protein
MAMLAPRRLRSVSRNSRRPLFECLEQRSLLTAEVFPNDPEFPQQWLLHNTGQTGGGFDADIDAPAAWSITTGSMATVVAVIDDGIDYTRADIYLNIWLNQDEIPADISQALIDSDGDGATTFRDLNVIANSHLTTDLNGNGYIDGGDLLASPLWSDGIDQDANGNTDDLIGWDFHNNDNNPMPSGSTHGTDMSALIGAMGNDGIGKAGVSWNVRLMPVRRQSGGGDDDASGAAGLDYAVAQGASISNNSWGNSSYSQLMYDSIDRARQAGHLFIAAAGNLSQDMDANPFYPAAYDLPNIVSAAATNMFDQLSAQTNFGLTNVDLGAPSPGGGTSAAAAYTSGVAALLQSEHPDWTYAQIKDRILSTIDPLPSLDGKTVSGGRLNAANALGVAQFSISEATANEGGVATFTVQLSSPNDLPVTVQFTTASGTASTGSDFTAALGSLTFDPGQTSKTITVNTIDDSVYEGNEAFAVNLTNPVGGVIVDGQGLGTIVDNDPEPTKFFVVDDATANKTFEYGASGTAMENYTVNGGNAAPRGAASTVTGDKVWVVDSNRNVYVYNTSGGLVGSWAAGGMNASAQVEGIATNGTDVWIVDAKQDKVYRYTGAAGRLSGSQNAASNFGLNSGNKDPKDIVTDGASLWVVNSSSTDKVFKYNLNGGLLGSWTISTSGATSPTGITLDPASPGHLWIVDSGTDRVYQYDNAVSRTSGSQAASGSFALAAGNANPQGIADPPVAKIDGGSPQGADSIHSSAANDQALLDVVEELGLFVFGSPKKRR